MGSQILVEATSIYKKYARLYKYSLCYEMFDLISEFCGSKKINRNLRKNEFWAAHDISFKVPRGECLGIIGENGSGKTTIVKLIAGLMKPDRGRLVLGGKVIVSNGFQAGFSSVLTGIENLYLQGALHGMSKSQIGQSLKSIVDFSGLGDLIHVPIETYSRGMKLRLAFSIAIHTNPDIVVFDELMRGGDFKFKERYLDWVKKNKSKLAIIMVTHQLANLEDRCDQIVVLKQGKASYQGRNINHAIEYYKNETAK